MSRYAGNSECCPVCGLTYKKLNTGLNYDEVYQMLWKASNDPTDWKYKRRGAVLGFWFQIKQEFWDQHLNSCAEGDSNGEEKSRSSEAQDTGDGSLSGSGGGFGASTDSDY